MRLKLSNIHKNIGIAIKQVRGHGLGHCAAAFWREIWFDFVRGTDTTLPEHPIGSAHSVHYQGADPLVVKELLDALPLEAKESTFIDFGCGKGRVLLLALEQGFQKVLGVEISPELALLCKRNLARAMTHQASAKVAVIEADATELELPSGALTAFFFNPFQGPPLERVAQKLASHADTKGSTVWVIYLNPVCLEVFIRHGFSALRTVHHGNAPLAVLAHREPLKAPSSSQTAP